LPGDGRCPRHLDGFACADDNYAAAVDKHDDANHHHGTGRDDPGTDHNADDNYPADDHSGGRAGHDHANDDDGHSADDDS
jgi:hypothetical protein